MPQTAWTDNAAYDATRVSYDASTVTYDSSTVTYDSVDTSLLTPKPTAWTPVEP